MEREKKEKTQKEREGGPGAMMFLFPCRRSVDDGDILTL
jgi:hypothetical protein